MAEQQEETVKTRLIIETGKGLDDTLIETTDLNEIKKFVDYKTEDDAYSHLKVDKKLVISEKDYFIKAIEVDFGSKGIGRGYNCTLWVLVG
jgi:hypothetical protein